MTAQDLITGAMRLFEGVEAGGTPADSELADGLTCFQNLLDSWNADELLVHATTVEAVTMTASTQSYALSTRPVKILSADFTVSGINSPVEVCGPERWAQVPDKAGSSAQVRFVFCDYQYSTANVLVAPIPAGVGTLKLYNTVDLAAVAASLSTTFALPEGYARALRFNLAVDFAPEFGMDLPAWVLQTATDTKAELRKLIASNRVGKSALEIPPVTPAQRSE
jgi:hypothetical protein